MSSETPSPVALDWIVLKIVQSCNLNCTYCYVYNRGDESWLTRPDRISEEVTRRLSERIAEQCAKHGLRKFTVEFHGGEPLLIGKEKLRSIIEELESRRHPEVRYQYVMQTNGLLLSEDWLALLEELDIEFGISLDGPPEVMDAYRVGKNGKGITQKLLDKITRLRAETETFAKLHAGCLCVVNPQAHGSDLVRWFSANGFDRFDFLLPDGNYVNFPAGWAGVEPFKEFLLDAYETWLALDADAPRIRLFQTMLLNLLGSDPRLDALGGKLGALCVVETDGSIGILDTLRLCGEPYSKDTLNIFDHPLDAHAEHYRLAELEKVPDQCSTCPQLKGCRGGYLPHRFDGTDFNHPSIYCDALFALSERMTQTLLAELPESCIVPVSEEV